MAGGAASTPLQLPPLTLQCELPLSLPLPLPLSLPLLPPPQLWSLQGPVPVGLVGRLVGR